MQRTKPKIISVGNSNRERSVNNLIGKIYFVVSWKKLDYEEVWNINESLGSCGLQKPRCREQDPKSANRASVCIKIHFRNRRRNGSQKLSRKWTWISTRVKELCKLWSFQTILFPLEGTKLEIEELMKLSQSKWMSELDALLCWRGCYAEEDIEKQEESYAKHMEKKQYIFRKMKSPGRFEGQRVRMTRITPIF